MGVLSCYLDNIISIHALLAESDISCAWSASKLGDFYPRSPCGERRLHYVDFSGLWRNFYPRSPCGERLEEVEKLSRVTVISIHALLAESDIEADKICKFPIISIHALLAESDV